MSATMFITMHANVVVYLI